MSARFFVEGCGQAASTAGALLGGPASTLTREEALGPGPEADAVHAHLRDVGRGMAWMRPSDDDVLDELRRVASERRIFGRALAHAPLVPESALVAATLLPREGRCLVRADLELAGLAHARRGGDVTLWLDEGVWPLDDLTDPLPSTRAALLDAVPAGERGAFDAVFVDTLATDPLAPPGITALLARACSRLVEGGQLLVLAHPLERGLVAAALDLLPLQEVRMLADVAFRTTAGWTVPEWAWDVWTATREPGGLPLDDDEALSASWARSFDPEAPAAWCAELHGRARCPDLDERARQGLDWLEASGALAVVHAHDEDDGARLRLTRGLRGGASLEVVVDRGAGLVSWAVLDLDVRLFLATGAALATFGPAGDPWLRFR